MVALPADHGRYQQRRVVVQRPLIWRYEAYDRMVELKVLLHELNPALAGDRVLRRRFLERVGAIVNLEHPRLGRILGLEDAGPAPAWSKRLSRARRSPPWEALPAQTALDLTVQIAELLIFLGVQRNLLPCRFTA